MRIGLYLGAIMVISLLSCGSQGSEISSETNKEVIVKVPAFNADSAFAFVRWQVEFGPRVPGTDIHKEVGEKLADKFRMYGATVKEQEFEVTTYDNTEVQLKNIIASFSPEKTKRILLAAHWDTRPFADKDPIDPRAMMDGANDGASGVAVLLEIARLLSEDSPSNVGVDIILFDGEDWGEHREDGNVSTGGKWDSWWCLGSQYWAANKHLPNYAAYYGILFDMVGARGSQFHKEGVSMRKAPKIVKKVWEQASKLGYGGIFVNKRQPDILDDHVYVNELGKIPMINIVHYDPENGYFGDYHHSRKDNLDLIDKNVLKMVGNTTMHVLYNE